MSYSHFNHQADIGIVSRGKSLEDVFEKGAKALFDIMVQLTSVEEKEKISLMCSSNDIEGLFVEWLNELIFQKDITGLVFSKFSIEKIKNDDKGYCLQGEAWGEKIDPQKHQIKVEAKGATFSQLSVKKKHGVWQAKCIIDV